MNLSGQQRQQLQEALIDAFPEKSSLERMLSFKLEKNLDENAGGGNLQEIVFNLIRTAKSQGWLQYLVYAAYEDNPGNSKLQAIARELLTVEEDIINQVSRDNTQLTINVISENSNKQPTILSKPHENLLLNAQSFFETKQKTSHKTYQASNERIQNPKQVKIISLSGIPVTVLSNWRLWLVFTVLMLAALTFKVSVRQITGIEGNNNNNNKIIIFPK